MRIKTFAIGLILLAGGGMAAAQGPQGRPPAALSGPGFTLASPAFADGGEIPSRFTQAVENPVSPQLEWTNVPANTVSFVLTLRDPDVALQRTVEDPLHWMVFNIPGTARGLPESVPLDPQLADGTVQAKNRRGGVGYMGPGAPAPGPHHHYTFELFAMDTKLNLGPDATRDEVLKAINGHIVGKAVLVGRFHR